MSPTEYIALGGLIVAFTGSWINQAIERRKRLSEKRAEVYIEYITSFVAMSYVVGDGVQDQGKHFDHLAARAKLVLFASPRVMDKLEQLYDGPAKLIDPEAGRRLADLIAAMQRDTCGFESNVDSLLKVIVYPGSGKP
jgi:hypothetical protein